jgi:hypothetical protein|tara:strand:- start:4100 stop:4390 length:291 start_codon:yes stop_codon:yes gene_type:complete
MDNITNMTDKDLEILAELLFDKLMQRQEEYDREFEESVQDMFKAGFAAELKLTEEELMIGELARLQTLMMLYENKEEYEKAAVLLKKVNDIKKRLR